MPELYLALRHPDDAIVASGTDFEQLVREAPLDCYFVRESWITAKTNSHRKQALLDGLNKCHSCFYADYGQRVDLAIGWLREQGVLSERYTSLLLSESDYGQLPSGSVAQMAITGGNASK